MAITATQIMAQIKKCSILLIKTTYRSIHHHPLLIASLILVAFLVRSFPTFFSVLISSSPVIVCTTVLLGLLLSYGEPRLPTIEENDVSVPTQQASSCKSEPPVDDLVVAEEERELSETVLHGLQEERELSENAVDGLQVRVGKPTEEERFDSSLGSPWLAVGIDDVETGSDESDGAESSSPDASMADIIPMLEELHPLLDSEPLQIDNADESDAGSVEEEEEEVVENAGGGEEAVALTADDQKNAMDLGISDIERNKRLESLIAKRRSRKDLYFAAERNLIDLDDLSDFPIPQIFAPRHNPFDLPFDPVPLSAPSVMQPRKNPFDVSFDNAGQSSQSSNHTTESFVLGKLPPPPVPPRDSFFTRHESFSLGAHLNIGEAKPEKPGSRLKPFFVVETEGEALFANYQRQLSGMSDSKVSSIPDSDTASSIVDQDHQNEVLEDELQLENEVLAPVHCHAEPVEQEQSSLEEVDLVNIDHIPSGTNMGDGTNMDEDKLGADASISVEETIMEKQLDTTILDATGLEILEDKYDVSSSSSLKADKEGDKENTYEELVHSESGVADSIKASGDAMHSVPGDSNFTAERVVDTEATFPVYDLSPSPTIKSLSNVSSFDEALLDAGEGGLNSNINLDSDLQADITGMGTGMTADLLEKDISTREVSVSAGEVTDLLSASRGVGLESLDLPSRDEKESELSNVAEQSVHPLILSSINTESSEASPIDEDKSLASEGDEIRDASTSYSDTSLLPDRLTSSLPEKAHQLTELFGIKPSSEAGNASSLPSIPEENVEHYKLEQHESITGVAGVGSLTGLQIVEEPHVGLSDIEQELSFYRKDSADETGNIVDTEKILHESEEVNASLPPYIPRYDTDRTGLSLLESKESLESSGLLDTMSEPENNPHSLSHDLPDDIDSIGEVHDKEENGSSDEYNKAPAAVGEIEGMDEDLLSELDAVGDFQISRVISGGVRDSKPQSDGQYASDDLNLQIYPKEQDFPSQVDFSEIRTLEDDGLHSEAHSNNMNDRYSVTNPMKAEVGGTSSSWPSGIDPEMTVYNSKLHILEASSFEELDSVFKIHHEEADVPHGSEPICEAVEGKTESAADKETSVSDPKLTESTSELHFLEARSIEDINSAFEQLKKKEIDNSVISDVEPSQNVVSSVASKSMGSYSDLEVVDAETLDDIHSAFKQHIDGTSANPLRKMEAQHDNSVISDVEPSENLVGSMPLESVGSHSDLEVVDAETLDDIHSAFKQHIDGTAANPQAQHDESVISDVKPSQNVVSSSMPSKSMGSYSDLEVVDAETLDDIHSAFKQHIDGTAANLQAQRDESVISDVKPSQNLVSSSMPSEAMGSYSDLEVVDAETLDDIHSAFKQHIDGTATNPQAQHDESVISDVKPSQNVVSSSMPSKSMGSYSDLEVVDAETLDDIHSAFKQHIDGTAANPQAQHDEPVISDVEPSQNLVSSSMPSEAMGSHSELEVVDAETLDDIHLAFKQLADGTTPNPSTKMEPQHDSAIGESSERRMEPGVLEVQSAEQIRLAFEAAVAMETGSSPGQIGDRSHELETIADDPSLGDASLRRARKKGKSIKSGSSSSSSSSDSE